MCGGSKSPYDAYSSGDFSKWSDAFDKSAAVKTALARGEIDQATADAQLAALTGDGSFDKLGNKVKRDASGGMEMREKERQLDVDLGKIGIDKAFSNFDDGYYDNYLKDYEGNYNPQLDQQYTKALGKTTANLAERGVLDSSVGNNAFADLSKQNAEAKSNIASEAIDATNKLRGQVQNQKSSLYNLNEASADPQAINAQALGSATSLVAPPTYSPLGEVFGSFLNGLATYQNARGNTPTKTYSSPYSTTYGSGSVIK